SKYKTVDVPAVIVRKHRGSVNHFVQYPLYLHTGPLNDCRTTAGKTGAKVTFEALTEYPHPQCRYP
ncbi:MAG: hypothetical protein AAB346_04080, partial [Pseudomonadota bacterium]